MLIISLEGWPLVSMLDEQQMRYRQAAATAWSTTESSRVEHELYRSASSSSGSGICAASCISFSYCLRRAASTWASGGARAGAATNS